MQGIEPTYQIYSPAAVIGLFNNALKLNATVNLIYLKGRYSYGGGKAYVNYYYDFLYSESDSTSIGVKMPGLLRSKIVNNELYTLRGFIEKRIKNSSIELVFVVDEIIAQEEKAVSEEDLKRYDLIQRKLEQGSRDLETFIRNKILQSEKVRIANVFGHNAIVQKDFYEGLDVSSKDFDIDEYTCNITSATSVSDVLSRISDTGYDVIALVRGGGDKQSFEVFNSLSLAEQFIALPSITITALGHTADETLLDKLADKRYHLPHDYGAGLHSILNKLTEEKSNSRALLIEEVRKDVSKQFVEQVTTLTGQLKKKNEEFAEAQKTFKEQVELQTKTFNAQLKVRNEEVEKLKKEISDTYGKQVQTLTEQLAKRNEDVQKLQENAAKQIQELNTHFTAQQKQRQEEMEAGRKEIAALYEKNMQSAINEKTAALQAGLDMVQQENKRLLKQVQEPKADYIRLIIAAVIALVIGFILAKTI
ncbi:MULTISPECIES: exodeoxyribonuclease VII large subunit [Chryseobacterium]|uniref:Exodeoxyribonuclease VII large subunit n=1 Tax=Chryseobacterium camelliae TaxID=1265445 RepID=A0ABU0TIH1_9FLAO|nr:MULTISPECIES: exodeoxyribonuclease VII large subunit [Chryseobacterium]MDT3409281.1 exodeoxyribonuclease VII large subunit [Pseudacidovorax intermedius]MDQ1096855.1 exodeoxyribonuclease VII large subunit [Chryseobacterium camelliae]MDQ1100797.1 exodeoxyribonuclease VII large subunit [Chryseobacterium sp. SORGH_AS_1048]MDR6084240.1 exodeoxyribonuclease VII large subunit [Chryseobacterium sp. SORGH_AS_0909]MDR6132512.1 exodeoxyribonuclease VII large subunit [Chryseobacterium sp. SORGH_AS_1175